MLVKHECMGKRKQCARQINFLGRKQSPSPLAKPAPNEPESTTHTKVSRLEVSLLCGARVLRVTSSNRKLTPEMAPLRLVSSQLRAPISEVDAELRLRKLARWLNSAACWAARQ